MVGRELRSAARAPVRLRRPGRRILRAGSLPGWAGDGRAQSAPPRRQAQGTASTPHAAPRWIATIGVYGFSGESFLRALARARIGLLLDVRQRRGVRGPEYAWANSLRLQAALAGAGIAYRHLRELAPTTELRHLQYREDARLGVGKRSRELLAPEYRRRYAHEILDRVDLSALVASIPAGCRAAMLCVERDPGACHRSLIAERLADRCGFEVTHLLPG